MIWLVPGLAVTAKFGTTWDFSPLASKILLENWSRMMDSSILRGMVFGEIEEFPLLGSADDLFDFLGRQLVDGRDGDVRLFDGIDFRELPQNILGFDRRNPLVGPVVAAHETYGSQNSTSHR